MRRKHSNRELSEKAQAQILALEATQRDIDRYLKSMRDHAKMLAASESPETRYLYNLTVRAIKNNLRLYARNFTK